MEIDQLVQRAFGAEATTEACVEMEKGASTRRYFRVSLKNAPVSSLVLMALPPEEIMRDASNPSGAAAELPFLNLQRHMSAAGLPVPAVYLDAVRDGAVLLEDLGPDTFNHRVNGLNEEAMEQWYLAAVTLLARMHDVMWPIPPECLAASRFFDRALLRWELDHYREFGIEARTGCPLNPRIRRHLDDAFDDFAEVLDAMPRGFVHRDYQSRNLMVKGTDPEHGQLTIIDFQDAFIGPRCYDLVALLNDSYVELSDASRNRIIHRYATLRGLPEQEVHEEFNLLTIQRKLKDGGRFIFIDRVRRDPSFLPFVSTSFGRVRHALHRVTDMNEIHNALAEADPEFFGH